MSKLMFLLACAFGVAACGRIENHHVVTGKARSPATGDVRIVMEGAALPDGFDEVAIVQTVGSGTKAELEPLIAGLKQEAQSLGCNAVVRVRVDQGSNHATAVGVAGVLAAP